MLVLSSTIIAEKNKISTTGAWLVLLEVAFEGVSPSYFVHNTEDITWDGKVWTAYPFDIDTVNEDSQGGLPTYAIKLSNVGRMMSTAIDEAQGGNGATLTLRVVHSEQLDETTPVFEDVAEVVGCSVSTKWVTFTLGAASPIRIRCPKQRYLQNHCRYKEFKGTLCGYTGAVGTCDRTMATCDSLGNLARFGGFPGIGLGGGVYI